MLKLRVLLLQCKHVDALRRRFSDVLINISANRGTMKMRMGEMSSLKFSESVDTRLDPELSAILEKVRLRTDFNILYRTDLNNTAGNTGPSSQAFRTDHGYYM